MTSAGAPIVATLVVALPQAPSAPEAPTSPLTLEAPPALEPPPAAPGEAAAPVAAAEPTPPPVAGPKDDADAEPKEAVEQPPNEPLAPANEAVAGTAETTDDTANEPVGAPTDPATDSAATPAEARVAARSSPTEHSMLTKRLASWTGRFAADEPTPTLEWRADGERYSAKLTPIPATDATGMEQLAVEVTMERGGEHFVTDMRMTRIAFSNFAQFVDRWDPDVMIHDDVIDGRFHSNSEIAVSRELGVAPEFRGRVTLAARDIATDRVGWLNRRAMFPEGLETSVRRIPLPEQTTTLGALAMDEEHLQRFEKSSAIVFYADGSYGSRPLDDSAPEQRHALSADQHYVVGGEDVDFELSGVIDGRVLVYTQARIVIADDLRYARDPRAADADDYLGLVAERTVEIAAPDVTGTGDLEIHASIYARHRFVVREYRSKPSGTLKILGSLTAGSLTATEPRFATQIDYDKRLETLRAPGFPLSDRYELASWSGEWRRADDAPPTATP